MKDQARISKIQELVYELKVHAVMTPRPMSVTSDTGMRELRTILRDNRISGAPVLDGTRLVGIISVEDFIKWLAEGGEDCAVGDRMSNTVETVYADESLVHVISKLEQFGFGRLPVVDRKSSALVGVITKGDIIEGLLHELEIGFDAEEIQHYRASHLFQDVLAESITLTLNYRVAPSDIAHGGEVSSKLKKSLQRLGIRPDIVRRAAISAYEAEMNVIIYAKTGTMTVTVDPDLIELRIADAGPGIPDVQAAMEPGYSTAPDWVRELGFGAGMGLHNIYSCAEKLDIASEVGVGTSLNIRFANGGYGDVA